VVHVVLESEDVIHSFFVPVFRLKQDVLPGRSITAWFEATETGEYEIACAELCGYAHYTMRAILTVHTAKDYASWLEEQWSS
jgi:cytochrome c oxidase subunit 2